MNLHLEPQEIFIFQYFQDLIFQNRFKVQGHFYIILFFRKH
nr:MAG TPA: hypothetical protein [Caudoviricetes sp.]